MVLETAELRYQLYIKRAVLTAHIDTIDEVIHMIERDGELALLESDFRIHEDDMFSKYLKIALEIE